MHPVIEWKNDRVFMIDQRLLPGQEVYVEHEYYTDVSDSIRRMVIRGAPAIGVAAAMGIALGLRENLDLQKNELESEFKKICDTMAATRPTAVNLFWAIQRMGKTFQEHRHDPYPVLREKMIEEALIIDREDVAINRTIGANGQSVLQSGQTVLTHCNAGELATAGFGTALGVVRAALDSGKEIAVIACETRPFLQGARLTVWELLRDNIPVSLITDNMAGYFMSKERIDVIVVGADRIAANGDVANKIGTYSLAILAQFHRIPFYVAAPLSTIDFSLSSGSEIPIEERDIDEVTHFNGIRVAPPGTSAFNPAFDVTPNHLVAGIITEKGLIRPEYGLNLSRLKEGPPGEDNRY